MNLDRKIQWLASAREGKKSKKKESPVAKLIIGGTMTVVFEAFGGGHFLEFLKIKKQTEPHRSYKHIMTEITQTKGIRGVLDGFMPWGFLQCIIKGAVFSWGQALSLNQIRGNEYLTEQQNLVLSGGVGGFVQGVCMSPVLLLKTRVMTDPSFRKSDAGVAASARVGLQVFKKEGPLALMKGVQVFSIKRFCDWTTRFWFVEKALEGAKYLNNNQELNTPMKLTAALAGGSFSAMVTIPIDVMVATVQQSNNAGQKVSVFKVYGEAIKAGGFGGTLKMATSGLSARVAHVALTTLLMKTGTSYVYNKMYSEEE
jgi:hypothetical protein